MIILWLKRKFTADKIRIRSKNEAVAFWIRVIG